MLVKLCPVLQLPNVLYLLGVSARMQAWYQVEDMTERHRIEVFNERREKVVDVAAAMF